jgi:hypothetical protein
MLILETSAYFLQGVLSTQYERLSVCRRWDVEMSELSWVSSRLDRGSWATMRQHTFNKPERKKKKQKNIQHLGFAGRHRPNY